MSDNNPSKIPGEICRTSVIAKAMAHPVRLYILSSLSKMNSCCYSGDVAEQLNIGRSTLSRHLKELKYAGLIQGEITPPYIKYCINRKNWEDAKRLFENLFSAENHESLNTEQPKKIY